MLPRIPNYRLVIVKSGEEVSKYTKATASHDPMFLELLVALDHASPKGIIFILLPNERQDSVLKAFFVMIWFLPKNVRWSTFCWKVGVGQTSTF